MRMNKVLKLQFFGVECIYDVSLYKHNYNLFIVHVHTCICIHNGNTYMYILTHIRIYITVVLDEEGWIHPHQTLIPAYKIYKSR